MTCPIGFHVPTVCERDNKTARFHTKSWSYLFACPECGASRRWNTNRLGGNFHPVCNGSKIVRHPRKEPMTYTVIVGRLNGAQESSVRDWPRGTPEWIINRP